MILLLKRMDLHEDIFRPLLRIFRRGRMRRFVQIMGVTEATSIIDLGGLPPVWSLIDANPQVTMVNIGAPEWSDGKLRMVSASGTDVPFPENAFDICFSNSVIEHVGGEVERRAFAGEVRRLARRYWVQTPNRRFFIEPHLLTAFLHWLPRGIERRLVRRLSLWGLITKPSLSEIDAFLGSIDLLDAADLQTLFPDAEIMRERFCWMVKSLVAIKK
jgi:hypothetical protein